MPSSSGTRGYRGGGDHNRGGRGRGRGRRRGGRGAANQSSSTIFSSQKNDPTRQVDVSFPSSRLAEQTDMEMIEMLLNLRNIKIEDKFNENENEYFRRGTIQLQRTDGKHSRLFIS
jgi:hypothetical protein